MNKGTGPVWEVSSDEFKKIINDSSTFKEILIKLGSKPNGGYYKTVKRRMMYEGIDPSCLDEKRKKLKSEQGKNREFEKVPLSDVLVKNSLYSSKHLKKRLIDEGLLESKCYECGIEPFWNGKDLTLQLDHKNGDSYDNRIENLRLLCPNCHSQTDTYAGKNRRSNKKEHECKECKAKIGNKTKKGMCRSCSQIHRNRTRYLNNPIIKHIGDNFKPSKEELIKLVKEKGYMETGRLYGVHGNAVKKWCKSYGILNDEYFILEKERVKYSNNKSGFKGVRFVHSNRYIVIIWDNGKDNYYGSFSTAREAALKADEVLVELFGSDAITNKKLGLL